MSLTFPRIRVYEWYEVTGIGRINESGTDLKPCSVRGFRCWRWTWQLNLPTAC